MRLFGSSGIRGIVNEKITPELCQKIGRAVGVEYKNVVLGSDPRPTADMVSAALISGLTSSGANVKRADMIPTPTLAHSAKDFDCGVMITASHNPEEYNGIKLFNPDGSSFNTEQMIKIEKRIFSHAKLSSWKGVGRVSEHEDAVEKHISSILECVGEGYEQKGVLDCANGAGCSVTPYLLKRMGCEVITLNAQPDGNFPDHPSEPKKDNLTDLSTLVKRTGADLGIAHDGDGDRAVAFDHQGNFMGGDELLALFTKTYPRAVAVPVNSSMVIDEIAEKVFRTKVGDVFVSEKLKEKDADFGGEPSGTWIFPEINYGPDGIYAAALLVKMNSEKDLKKEVEGLPSFPRKKEAVPVENKSEVMDDLISLYENTYPSKNLNLADGIRLEEERGWSLIRASGTEPKIRITAEAESKEALETIFEKAKKQVKNCVEEKR